MSDLVFPAQYHRYTSSYGRRARTGLVQTEGHEWRYQRGALKYRAAVRLSEMPDAERASLFTFFETHLGAGDSFLFDDPITAVQYRVRFVRDLIDVQADFYQNHAVDLDVVEAE